MTEKFLELYLTNEWAGAGEKFEKIEQVGQHEQPELQKKASNAIEHLYGLIARAKSDDIRQNVGQFTRSLEVAAHAYNNRGNNPKDLGEAEAMLTEQLKTASELYFVDGNVPAKNVKQFMPI